MGVAVVRGGGGSGGGGDVIPAHGNGLLLWGLVLVGVRVRVRC